MVVQNSITKSSDEERLFQVYKEIAIPALIKSKNISGGWHDLESICNESLQETKIILQVFNERNLNEPTNQ